MKQRLLVCLLILALLLAGCGVRGGAEAETKAEVPIPALSTPAVQERDDTDEDVPAPGTETPTATAATEAPALAEATESFQADPNDPELTNYFEENPAFTRIAGPNCDPSILAVICNAPNLDGVPAATATWNEGEYDQLILCPRWIGSMVDVWEISRSWNGEEEVQLEGPVYSALCEAGDCYAAALDRPEGGSRFAVSVTVPEYAYGYLELNYNGRYGTLAREFVMDNSAAINAAAQTMDPYMAQLLADWIGPDPFYAFLRSAYRSNIDPWAAMQKYCTTLLDYGDGAAYTASQGEMEGDTYRMEAAMLREGYDPGEGSIADRAEGQAKRYAEIGNQEGILGIDRDKNDPLYFELKGLTVYNPTLLAQEVEVKVNGIDAGTYALNEGDLITLLDVQVEEIPADTAIKIEVRITKSRGEPSAAILELWPGVGGNISGSR